MSSDWPKRTVRDLQDDGLLLVEDGNHGEYRPRPDEFGEGKVSFIRAADIADGRVLFDTAQRINPTALSRIRKGLGRGGDVLLSHKGTVGKVAFVPLDSPPFVCSPQTTFWRTLAPERIDRRYLCAYLCSVEFRQQLDSRANETDMAGYVSLTAQRTFEIPIPPIEIQRFIGETLGSLDDKIELNRRMNATLESMASAIFKSWFIDFDPVHRNAAHRAGQASEFTDHLKSHPKSSNFDSLFPDSFEESGIGDIPACATVCSLYDTAEYVNGAAFRNSDFCDSSKGLPVIKIAELKYGISQQTKYSTRILPDTQMVRPGALLYSWSGSPDTSLDVFVWTLSEGLLNQHIFKVICNSEPQKHFVYYLLRHMRSVLIEIARNKQTTGLGHVTVADMRRLMVCLPPPSLLQSCDRVFSQLFDQCLTNQLEIERLSKLRNILLHQLLSGELSGAAVRTSYNVVQANPGEALA